MISHEAAIDIIRRAGSETTLSYEETVAVYLRARGLLRDGEDKLGAPVPSDWAPKSFDIDRAWSAVISDDALKSIRSRMSVADLRQLINAIATTMQ